MTTDLKDITAVILAGGLGTRLRSVVDDRSKVMAEVNGRPFLTYLLDQVAAAGIRRVVLCTGHQAEHLEETLGDRYGDVQLVYSREESPLGTGGAVRAASKLLTSDAALVMNGDSYCSADVTQLFGVFGRYHAMGAVCLCEKSDTSAYGKVELSDEGAVVGFMEKDASAGPGWINAGVYVLSRELIESIPADGAVSLERDVFPKWAGRGLYGYASNGELLDIGTPERYDRAAAFLTSLNSAGERRVVHDY